MCCHQVNEFVYLLQLQGTESSEATPCNMRMWTCDYFLTEHEQNTGSLT